MAGPDHVRPARARESGRRLAGRVAVITGAGGGIGRACAMLFAREGAVVVCCGRTAATLEETVAAVKSLGADGSATVCDVSIESDCAHAVAAAAKAHGRLDILGSAQAPSCSPSLPCSPPPARPEFNCALPAAASQQCRRRMRVCKTPPRCNGPVVIDAIGRLE